MGTEIKGGESPKHWGNLIGFRACEDSGGVDRMQGGFVKVKGKGVVATGENGKGEGKNCGEIRPPTGPSR